MDKGDENDISHFSSSEDEDGDEEDLVITCEECSKHFLEKEKGCSVVRSLCALCNEKDMMENTSLMMESDSSGK
jgi:hypothetical protein